jgi:hypothetical protein
MVYLDDSETTAINNTVSVNDDLHKAQYSCMIILELKIPTPY